MILEYWGTEVNTQFDVVFEYSKDKFTLKKFFSTFKKLEQTFFFFKLLLSLEVNSLYWVLEVA